MLCSFLLFCNIFHHSPKKEKGTQHVHWVSSCLPPFYQEVHVNNRCLGQESSFWGRWRGNSLLLFQKKVWCPSGTSCCNLVKFTCVSLVVVNCPFLIGSLPRHVFHLLCIVLLLHFLIFVELLPNLSPLFSYSIDETSVYSVFLSFLFSVHAVFLSPLYNGGRGQRGWGFKYSHLFQGTQQQSYFLPINKGDAWCIPLSN